MAVSVAAGFFRPVTSIVSVWVALLRPLVVKTTVLTSSVEEYVSTSVTKAPSTKTRAMPPIGARKPIQLTDVPVKVNMPSAPAAFEYAAVPPLHVLLVSPRVQAPEPVTDGSVSSKRVTVIGGGGGALETVTVTGTDVVRLLAASRATAVRVWPPLLVVVVSQGTEYGTPVSSAPRLMLSSLNWTPTTPRSSEAVAVTVIVADTVAPLLGAVIPTWGGVV